MFSLTAPCGNCPFRSDVKPYLRPDRVRQIIRDVFERDSHFQCHKTIEHDDDGEAMRSTDSKICAGSLILGEKIGRPSQLARISERLGGYDRTLLKMDSPVYDTPTQMLKAYQKAARPAARGKIRV